MRVAELHERVNLSTRKSSTPKVKVLGKEWGPETHDGIIWAHALENVECCIPLKSLGLLDLPTLSC